MSLNLKLTDRKSKTKFDLYQTPTDVTKACLSAGNTAGILKKYLDWLETCKVKEDELSNSDRSMVKKTARMLQYTGLSKNDALNEALAQHTQNGVISAHALAVKDYVLHHQTATFEMV